MLGTMADGWHPRRVFISYAPPEEGWARWADWHLTEAGHQVELDLWDWAAGDNRVAALSDAIEHSDCVLALLSPAYLSASAPTRDHWPAVLARRGRFVPLVVAEVPRLPALLLPLISCELTGRDESDARAVLLSAVDGPVRPVERPPFPGLGPGRAASEAAGPAPRFPGEGEVCDGGEAGRGDVGDVCEGGGGVLGQGGESDGGGVGDGVPYELTQRHIDELARAFPPGPACARVLRMAGFDAGRVPGMYGVSAAEFWSAVAEAVALGAMPDGARLLILTARRLLPGNPVFAAGPGNSGRPDPSQGAPHGV